MTASARSSVPALALFASLTCACTEALPERCENGPFDCPAEWASWPMRKEGSPYTAREDEVFEPLSGLSWQRATPAVMHRWQEAGDYCDGLELAGHADWRLPSRLELLTLVDYPTEAVTDSPEGFGEPMIDQRAFRDTPPAQFWTASHYFEENILSDQYESDVAWTVDFRTGFVETQVVELMLPRTRCVRTERAPEISPGEERFEITESTVTEKATGLVWALETFDGDSYDVRQHCESLDLDDFTGFRVPHVKELMTIVSAVAPGSALDPSVFDFGGFYLWTSTPWPVYESGAYRSVVLDVDNQGRFDYAEEDSERYAMCVWDPESAPPAEDEP